MPLVLRYRHGSGGIKRQPFFPDSGVNSSMTDDVSRTTSTSSGTKTKTPKSLPRSPTPLSKVSVDGNKLLLNGRHGDNTSARPTSVGDDPGIENDKGSTHSSLNCDFESLQPTNMEQKCKIDATEPATNLSVTEVDRTPEIDPLVSNKDRKLYTNSNLPKDGADSKSPSLTTGLKLLGLQERDKGTGIKVWLQEAKNFERQYKASAQSSSGLPRSSSSNSLSGKGHKKSATSPSIPGGQMRRSHTESQLSKKRNPREPPKYMPSYSMTPVPDSLDGTKIKLSGYFHHQMPRHKRDRSKSVPTRTKQKNTKETYQKPEADPKRPRPWMEKTPPLSDNTDTYVEIHYNSYLPKGKWLEYKPKAFTYNHKHGDSYETRIRTEYESDSEPDESFIWENQYQIWLFEKNGKKETASLGGTRRVQSAREPTKAARLQTAAQYRDTSSSKEKSVVHDGFKKAKWTERPKSAIQLRHSANGSENPSTYKRVSSASSERSFKRPLSASTQDGSERPQSASSQDRSDRPQSASAQDCSERPRSANSQDRCKRPQSAKSVAWADEQEGKYFTCTTSASSSQLNLSDASNIIIHSPGDNDISLSKHDRLQSSNDGVARFLHVEDTPLSVDNENVPYVTTPASETINTFCMSKSPARKTNTQPSKGILSKNSASSHKDDVSDLRIQGTACERSSKVCVVRPHTACGTTVHRASDNSRPQSAPPVKHGCDVALSVDSGVQTEASDCVQECLKTLENIQKSLKAYAKPEDPYIDAVSASNQNVNKEKLSEDSVAPYHQTKTVDVSVKEVNGEIIKTVTVGEQPAPVATSGDYVLGKGESVIFTDNNGQVQAQVSSMTFPDGERRVSSENVVCYDGDRRRPHSARVAEGSSALSRSMRKMYRRRANRPSSANSNTTEKIKSGATSHQDLFEKFNWMRIEKIKRRKAATCIQRYIRGWLVRTAFKNMIKKAFEEHHKTWWKFVEEYKALVARIQKRYGIKKASTPFAIKDVKEYMQRKHNYEQVFDDMSRGSGKLAKGCLPEFFRKCSLYPLEREIEESFKAVFNGCGTRAEVVFMLDCSASVGQFNFKSMMTFVKDMVRHFELNDSAVRIGVIPFNDDVFSVIGIDSYDSRDMLFAEIDALKYKGGLTRTDSAIKEMRQMLSNARPNCPLVGIVITDGQSYHTNKTKKEAALAKQEGVQMFAVGVGQNIDKEELVAIASDPSFVHTVYSYHALHKVKNAVTSQTCLTNCALCHFKDSTECSERCRGLYKSEVLEILWMIYCPKATGLVKYRKSTWMNPMVGEEDAMRFTEARPIDDPSFKTCMELVVKSKLEREGAVDVPHPTDNTKVHTVKDYNKAMDYIEEYIQAKREAEEQAAELRSALRKLPTNRRVQRKYKQVLANGENYFKSTSAKPSNSEQFKTVV